MNESDRLFATVESIRAEKYPDLDADLVRDVLSGQIRLQDDRSEAHRYTDRAISRWAAEHPADDESGATP